MPSRATRPPLGYLGVRVGTVLLLIFNTSSTNTTMHMMAQETRGGVLDSALATVSSAVAGSGLCLPTGHNGGDPRTHARRSLDPHCCLHPDPPRAAPPTWSDLSHTGPGRFLNFGNRRMHLRAWPVLVCRVSLAALSSPGLEFLCRSPLLLVKLRRLFPLSVGIQLL